MELLQIEEYLRQKLIATVNATGSLCHPDVVRISQQLDRLLCQIQHVIDEKALAEVRLDAK